MNWGAQTNVDEGHTTMKKAASKGSLPESAVTPGSGGDSEDLLYVCRASIFGSLQPGKIRSGFDGCYIPFAGIEYHAPQYEVLSWDIVDPYTTRSVTASNGYVPPDAIRGGTDLDGTPLYLCAAEFKGSHHPGKLRQDFGACDISFGGGEYLIPTYTVVTMQWRPSANPGLLYPSYGTDIDGASLYICRANYFGLKIPGKTRSSFG